MTGLTDLVGVLLNCGMISSGDTRIINAIGSSGLEKTNESQEQSHFLTSKKIANTTIKANSATNLLISLFKSVSRVLGIKKQPVSSSGAVQTTGLKDVVLGGKPTTKQSTLGAEAMTLLVILAFQAFKNINRQPAGMRAAIGSNEILLGLRNPANAAEEIELEQTASLVLKGMINAVKANSQIGNEEILNIISHIRESDSDEDIQQLIFAEMQLPLNLDSLVNEIPNEAVAAQVYAASLFAIEVDTPAEREYLEQFVQRTGLDAGVAEQLQHAVGVS